MSEAKRHQYTEEFKTEAVRLLRNQARPSRPWPGISASIPIGCHAGGRKSIMRLPVGQPRERSRPRPRSWRVLSASLKR